MPVERHAERLATPLSRRDRHLLFVLGAVVVIALVAGVLYLALRGGTANGERCFTATYASSVGGATVHHCGADAVHYCRVDAGIPQVAEACRKAGFAVGPSR